jgi:hypothetical protein
VRSVLLGAADRHQDRGLAATDRGRELGRGEVFEKDARRRLRERRRASGERRDEERAQRQKLPDAA